MDSSQDQLEEQLSDSIPAMITQLEVEAMTEIQRKLFYMLTGMAMWAREHPSTSRFDYISPERVKAHEGLSALFKKHWYSNPYISDAQRKMSEDSLSHGLYPAAVIEHTADGHHPTGWSWGSEYYIADFYLCAIRAMHQRAVELGCDVNDRYAPVYIALKVYRLNRVEPTLEILKAMNERLKETEETRSYGVVSAEAY